MPGRREIKDDRPDWQLLGPGRDADEGYREPPLVAQGLLSLTHKKALIKDTRLFFTNPCS